MKTWNLFCQNADAFLDKNIPYLEGEGRGGVPRALKKKIYPVWFLKSQSPLVSWPTSGHEKKKWNPPILDKILPLKLSLDTLDTLATSNIELAPKYGQNIVKLSKFS